MFYPEVKRGFVTINGFVYEASSVQLDGFREPTRENTQLISYELIAQGAVLAGVWLLKDDLRNFRMDNVSAVLVRQSTVRSTVRFAVHELQSLGMTIPCFATQILAAQALASRELNWSN